MKPFRILLLVLFVSLPPVVHGQRSTRAERAWKPFIASLRAAVKKRDRVALNNLMSREFYFLSSGGDENGNEDSRDEAFAYWETTGIGAWEALETVLAQGSVNNVAMRDPGNRRPSRVAPPLANNKQAIAKQSFEWYAIFEFINGRWYMTAFSQCCD